MTSTPQPAVGLSNEEADSVRVVRDRSRPDLQLALRARAAEAGHPLQQGGRVAVEQRDRPRLVDRRRSRARPRRRASGAQAGPGGRDPAGITAGGVGRRGVPPARGGVVQGPAEPVHARGAGRHDDRGQVGGDGAVDRRQVLRRRPRPWTRPATPRCSPGTCTEKIGDAYPMSPFLQGQIFGLLEDSRWDIAYLGMQIIIESLALAAFGDLLRRTSEPLLSKLLRYVMADEARHVAFGIVSLSEYYRDLTSAELKDRQEFLLENTLRNRQRSTTPEVWERLGVRLERSHPLHGRSRQPDRSAPVPVIPAGLLLQAGTKRGQARPPRRQPGIPAGEVGRGRPDGIRTRRRHGERLRGVRRDRGGASSGAQRGSPCRRPGRPGRRRVSPKPGF